MTIREGFVRARGKAGCAATGIRGNQAKRIVSSELLENRIHSILHSTAAFCCQAKRKRREERRRSGKRRGGRRGREKKRGGRRGERRNRKRKKKRKEKNEERSEKKKKGKGSNRIE